MAKNLNLGNFLTILRSNISKLQIFLKNSFHSNWRSYIVLTSRQKPKKSLQLFFEKNMKVSDFGLIWRPFCKYLQIKNFFFKSPGLWLFYLYSPLTSRKKSEKSFELFLRKLRYQPTNQSITNNTDLIGPHWYWSKKISILVNNSNSTSVFFKQTCYANPGADKKWVESSSYISIHLFLKFPNISASNNVSLWTYTFW